MTKAEAAYILDNLAWLGPRDEQDKVEAAIRIAVEELRSGGENGMDDLISRQAAIDIANDLRACISVDGYWAWVERLKRLPSAERKKGRWKPFDLTWGRSIYFCTACSDATEVPTSYDKPVYKYCPWCGAEMENSDE